MSSPSLSNVQSLIGLARSNGIDVRTTLLRVLVDQFAAEERHSAAEVTRFGELVLNLLPRADENDRAIVAEKLAAHPQTPEAVARRLAADTARVARPVLLHCRALSDDDLFLAVRSGDLAKAVAVAEREDIGLAPLVALEEMDEPVIRAALAARIGRAFPAADRRETAADLGARFLAAGPAGREGIVAGLALAAPTLPAGYRAPPGEHGRAVERAALSRRPAALAEALASALGLDHALAARIAGDEGGEPLVAAARALDLGRDATVRILLLSHEAVATSVERVQALASLYEAMPRPVAVMLARSWQAAAETALPVRQGRHQPVFAPDASERVGARQAASPVGRAAPRQGTAAPAGQRRPRGG